MRLGFDDLGFGVEDEAKPESLVEIGFVGVVARRKYRGHVADRVDERGDVVGGQGGRRSLSIPFRFELAFEAFAFGLGLGDPATDDGRVGAGVEGSAVLIEFAMTFGDEDAHLVILGRWYGRHDGGRHGGDRRGTVFGSEESGDPCVEWFAPGTSIRAAFELARIAVTTAWPDRAERYPAGDGGRSSASLGLTRQNGSGPIAGPARCIDPRVELRGSAAICR
jgi:hypothetical protein